MEDARATTMETISQVGVVRAAGASACRCEWNSRTLTEYQETDRAFPLPTRRRVAPRLARVGVSSKDATLPLHYAHLLHLSDERSLLRHRRSQSVNVHTAAASAVLGNDQRLLRFYDVTSPVKGSVRQASG